jgi:two-component system nitrogen regulation response regulator GlnG
MSDSATILIADDDRSIRAVLSKALGRLGYAVRTTANASTLWRWASAGEGDLVITDVVMPDGDGLEMLPRLRESRPEMPVIVMSARNTLMTAIKANERGAYEYLPKPFDLNELTSTVRRALSEPDEPDPANEDLPPEDNLPLVGRSQAMQEVYRVLARLMATDLTVMITGESGTGKELVARALHDFGKRKDHPFVAVNMAAIPRELIESELFGHERGAFTGATTRSTGRFEQADGGTLFLDEIGDMPPEAQTRLLRVLQEGEYVSVGGHVPIRADVRIVAATHRDLTALIDQGLFREDLFYRLNVVPLRLPPLRDRIEDIPLLIQHFLNKVRSEGLPAKSLNSAAMDRMMAHSWPGNVRELENLVRRLAALYSEEVITAESIASEIMDDRASGPNHGDGAIEDESLSDSVDRHISQYFAAHRNTLPASGLYTRIIREVERPLIIHTLAATGGNQVRAAQVLGLNRNTLRKKIRELEIRVVRSTK